MSIYFRVDDYKDLEAGPRYRTYPNGVWMGWQHSYRRGGLMGKRIWKPEVGEQAMAYYDGKWSRGG